MTDAELSQIHESFPDLYLDRSRNVLRGELSFRAHFDGSHLHLNDRPDRRYRGFSGCYLIEIDLIERDFNGFYKLREVGGKLATVIKRRGLNTCLDAHVNGDGSCCVGIFHPIEAQSISPARFVREVVFSYFAWHAYWEAFDKKAPWGEYSHQNGISEKVADLVAAARRIGRNDPCYCGSRTKYKFCCLPKIEAEQKRAREQNVNS